MKRNSHASIRQSNPRRTATRLGACLLTALLAGAAAAGDAEPAEPAAPDDQPKAAARQADQAADREASEQEKAPAGAGEDGESPAVFVPSEEISEDFAVSFPVDI